MCRAYNTNCIHKIFRARWKKAKTEAEGSRTTRGRFVDDGGLFIWCAEYTWYQVPGTWLPHMISAGVYLPSTSGYGTQSTTMHNTPRAVLNTKTVDDAI